MRTIYRLFGCGSLALLGAIASADVAYNNYTPLYGYDTTTGWTLSGSSSGLGEFANAEQFTAGAGGILQDIILPLSNVGGSGTLDVALYSDAGNTLGASLQTWTATTGGSFGVNNPSVLVAGNGSTTLTLGDSYWVVVVPSSSATSNLWAAWNWNTTGAVGNQGTSNDGGATWNYSSGQTMGAFKVDVLPTPEPMSMIVLAGGIGVLVRKRRNRA